MAVDPTSVTSVLSLKELLSWGFVLSCFAGVSGIFWNELSKKQSKDACKNIRDDKDKEEERIEREVERRTRRRGDE